MRSPHPAPEFPCLFPPDVPHCGGTGLRAAPPPLPAQPTPQPSTCASYACSSRLTYLRSSLLLHTALGCSVIPCPRQALLDPSCTATPPTDRVPPAILPPGTGATGGRGLRLMPHRAWHSADAQEIFAEKVTNIVSDISQPSNRFRSFSHMPRRQPRPAPGPLSACTTHATNKLLLT